VAEEEERSTRHHRHGAAQAHHLPLQVGNRRAAAEMAGAVEAVAAEAGAAAGEGGRMVGLSSSVGLFYAERGVSFSLGLIAECKMGERAAGEATEAAFSASISAKGYANFFLCGEPKKYLVGPRKAREGKAKHSKVRDIPLSYRVIALLFSREGLPRVAKFPKIQMSRVLMAMGNISYLALYFFYSSAGSSHL
jgi:hypothetical protein